MRATVSTLNYSAALPGMSPDEPWVIDALSNPPEWLSNFREVPVETPIHDVRQGSFEPTLERNGFEMVLAPSSTPSAGLEAESPEAVAAYRDEMARLVQDRTGADHVVVFDTTVRRQEGRGDGAPSAGAAHLRVHVDQNATSARARVDRHAEPGLRHRRFRIINLWRPLVEPVRNFPLALCDFRSVDVRRDLAEVRLDFPDWLQDRENYSVRANADHRWHYWDALTPDEVLMFTCYDSASRDLAAVTGRADEPDLLDVAGLCPHTAFLDPSGPTTGRLRTSIELRALVFHV